MVEDIAYLGDMTRLPGRLDSGRYIRVTKTNALRGDPDAISWDETVWASWARLVRLGADRHDAPSPLPLAAHAVPGASCARWLAASASPAGRW